MADEDRVPRDDRVPDGAAVELRVPSELKEGLADGLPERVP